MLARITIMGERCYYIETDGQVYLVKRDDRWRLPRAVEEIPFEIEPHERLIVNGCEILYCAPVLEGHPHEWHHKDEIPSLDEVEPLARQAVHYTLPRVVAEAIILRGDHVLLVMPSRGFNTDRWTLPGGFVAYGEAPAESVAREVREEVGVPCCVEACLGVETFVGRTSFYTWHMFFYRAQLLSEEFQPAPDEIKDVRWFPLSEAAGILHGAMRRKIEGIWSQKRSE